ncbi:MAG: hypothetical protein WDZ40_01610 [Candidatus Spechtbacterales bacterium]
MPFTTYNPRLILSTLNDVFEENGYRLRSAGPDLTFIYKQRAIWPFVKVFGLLTTPAPHSGLSPQIWAQREKFLEDMKKVASDILDLTSSEVKVILRQIF